MKLTVQMAALTFVMKKAGIQNAGSDDSDCKDDISNLYSLEAVERTIMALVPLVAMKLKVSDTDKANRLASLQKRKVLLDGLYAVLHAPVLGDFLAHKHPQKKIMKVVKSYNAAMLLQQLLPQNPQPELLPLLEQAKVSTLHETARAIVGVNRTVELGRAVFSLFWLDIVRLTIPVERRSPSIASWQDTQSKRVMAETAKRCNKVFSFIERRHINWELLPRDFRAEVAFEMEEENGGDQDYYHLLDSFIFKEFWDLRASYPNHPDHQKDAVMARIAEYLQQRNAGKLPEILRAEFERHGVEMRYCSTVVGDFFAGVVFCDPEKVEMVYNERLGWMEAVRTLSLCPAGADVIQAGEAPHLPIEQVVVVRTHASSVSSTYPLTDRVDLIGRSLY
ncbi:hypothetical protein HDU96_001188 [Phlyctochytrium bullatum]|nr:hypothetical protein HDU96_001188 [Phlyctochytrium bullatum]